MQENSEAQYSCYQPKQQRKITELHGQGHIRQTGLLGSVLSQTPSVSRGFSSVPELLPLEDAGGKAHLPQMDAAKLSSYLQCSEALG